MKSWKSRVFTTFDFFAPNFGSQFPAAMEDVSASATMYFVAVDTAICRPFWDRSQPGPGPITSRFHRHAPIMAYEVQRTQVRLKFTQTYPPGAMVESFWSGTRLILTYPRFHAEAGESEY